MADASHANGMLVQKSAIRKTARERVRTVPEEVLRDYSTAAARQLLLRPEFQHAHRVLAFLPLKDELDLSPALDSALRTGKTIALPRYIPDQNTYCAALFTDKFSSTDHSSSLAPGAFGIREPAAAAPVLPLNQLDFILVPGVAFDPSGRRLGRGKGFYDRLLAETNNACIKCGVALEEQLVAAIPFEAHDVPMNFILTPSRWIVCKEVSCR